MKSNLKLGGYLVVSYLLIGLTFSCKKTPNFPPVAVFSINYHIGYPGSIFTFDASASSDPDNDNQALVYRWRFSSDDTRNAEFQTEAIANWSYESSGLKIITLVVKDPEGIVDQCSDTIRIFEPNKNSFFIDSRDGHRYPTVEINGTWWFAENLQYGDWIPSSKFQTNNGIVEFYSFRDEIGKTNQYGGLYFWDEAMDYNRDSINQGICPEGWRIPQKKDFQNIDLVAPHQFILDYFGPNGFSGLNLQFGGGWKQTGPFGKSDPAFSLIDSTGWVWTTEFKEFVRHDDVAFQAHVAAISNINYEGLIFGFLYNYIGDSYLYTDFVVKNKKAFSVRCVKDK